MTARTAAGTMTCLLGHAAALVALYVVAVWTVAGQALDTAAMDTVGAVLGGEWADQVLDVVSPATVVLGTAVVTAVGYGSWGVAGALRAGGTVVATVVGAQLLKAVLLRPAWLDDAANSLPSGHAAAVAGLALAAVAAAPPALRRVTAHAGLAGFVLTGVATLAEGWHRPSDVVAAALLASMIALAMERGARARAPWNDEAAGQRADLRLDRAARL